MFYNTFLPWVPLQGPPRGPQGGLPQRRGPPFPGRAGWLALAGFGWLAFRISVGFRLDSRSGLDLALRLDLAFGFHLLRFCLDFI